MSNTPTYIALGTSVLGGAVLGNGVPLTLNEVLDALGLTLALVAIIGTIAYWQEKLK